MDWSLSLLCSSGVHIILDADFTFAETVPGEFKSMTSIQIFPEKKKVLPTSQWSNIKDVTPTLTTGGDNAILHASTAAES